MGKPGTSYGNKGKCILLVDDEAAAATANEFASFGYEVIVEHSGAGAEERVRSDGEVGLVLPDVDLGEGEDSAATARSLLSSRNRKLDKINDYALRGMPLDEYIPDLAAEIVGMFPNGGSVAVESRIEDFKLPASVSSGGKARR